MSSVTAVYLNETSGVWEETDLRTIEINGNIATVCSKHLTAFAIKDKRLPAPEPEVSITSSGDTVTVSSPVDNTNSDNVDG